MKETNGLKTKMFMKEGRIFTKAFCVNSNDKEKAYYFPQESAYCWYPLYPYYNYYFLPNYNDIMLVVDINAPSYVKETLAGSHIHLNNMYNYTTGVPVTPNFIMDVNLGVEEKLTQEGFVTWSKDYKYKDVVANREKIMNTIDLVNRNILFKQEKDTLIPRDSIDKNTYSYASERELSKLMEMGCALNMNNYMKKVAKVREGM